MDEVAVRCRKVRCPNCRGLLAEPGSPVYECPFCSTLLVAKGIPPDSQGDSWQIPNENNQGIQGSQLTNELEANSIDGSEPIKSQRQDQLNDHETNKHVSIDGKIKHQEQLLVTVQSEIVSVVKNRSEQELQLENDVGNRSTSVGDNASKTSTVIGEEGMAEAQLLLDHMNEQVTLSKGDDKAISQLPVEDADNCGMPSASEKEREFNGECEGMEGRNHKECHPAGEGNEQNFQSEIIRDNDYELSFKYISSALASNNQLAPRKRTSRLSKLSSEASGRLGELSSHLTDRLPSSSDEDSDDYESYSSASGSASHDSLDSEFDFPSPSAESMQPANLSDLLFQQKTPPPDVHCDVPATPHQLEWQSVDHENKEIALQNLNGAIASSVGVDAESASDLLNGMEQGDQVERAEVDWHHQKEDPIKKEIFSVGLQDTVAIVIESLQREDGFSGIGGPADIVGSADLKGGDSAETEEDFNGYQNKQKSMSNNDLQEEVSGSPDCAEHPLKLKSGSTLKEGHTASTLILGTEPPTWSLSDGSKVETCFTQENIKPISIVANVQLDDSIATIPRENAAITGNAGQSKIASQMVFIKQIPERSNVPTYLARNKEPESVGIQSSPFVTEQGNSSAVNNSESRLHHKRYYSSEATQGHNREGTVNIFDSRLHHKRNYSFEETQMQSELSNKYTSEVQKNMHNEGLHMPRSSEGSSRTHLRHAQAAYELADGQGPWLPKQNHQADLHMMDHSMNYSGPSNNVHGVSPACLQHHGSTYYSNGSNSFPRAVPNASLTFSYKAPSHPRLPVPMPGQAFVHCGCHSAAPVCMACIHCQHSHLPQLSMPPCGFCYNQTLSVAHQQGHAELWNCHQIQPSDQGASVVCCSPTCLSPQIVHMHDTMMAVGKPLVSSARKPKHYPPLPRRNTAPYVICKGCDEILEVPTDIPPSHRATQKLRCGVCYKVAKFSAFKGEQGTCKVALQSTTSEASTSTSHAVQYTEHTRPLPVLNVVQSMESSYHQGINSGLHPRYKQGSFDSQRQISAVIKRRSRTSSLDEIVQSTQCEAATPDHDSQDEFFFRSVSRHTEFDSSRIFFNGFKASSSTLGASNFSDDGSVVGNGIPLQAPVDEKEEGLDFGAPRMSDGESLDQRSPESRMRSPENKQHFQLLDLNRHTKDSLGDEEACWTTESVEHQVFDLKKKNIAQGKRPSTSLISLLSQESSKFEINMQEGVSFDKSRSALWSTASSSPMHGHHTNEMSNAGDNITSQPHKLISNRFVRKGPRYVADMLRRSIKDFHRGSQ